MTEKIVVVERGSRGRAIVGIVIIAFLIIAVFFTLYATGYWQPPAGDDSGPNQRVWFKTTITCSNQFMYPWNPKIEYIRTKQTSDHTSYNMGNIINPLWDDQCILAVSIQYPNGKESEFSDKAIYLENGIIRPEQSHFDYAWFTTWSGQHTIIVKLFRDEDGGRGELYDSKSKNVDV